MPLATLSSGAPGPAMAALLNDVGLRQTMIIYEQVVSSVH